MEFAFLLILYIDPGNGPWKTTIFETYKMEASCVSAGQMYTVMTNHSMTTAGKAPQAVWFECRPVRRFAS